MRHGASLLLLLGARVAHAEIYPFDFAAVPPRKTLEALYNFYILVGDGAARKDAPGGGATPRLRDGSFVEFHDLQLWEDGDKVEDYYGVQVGLVPYADFWTAIDQEHFCCDPKDLAENKCSREQQMVTSADTRLKLHTVIGTDEPRASPRLPVFEAGPYVLIISNCGDRTGMQVKGQVIVRNPNGYLPGSDVRNLQFFRTLSIVYLFLGFLWFCVSLRWYEQLFRIQTCISAVIGLGMLEAWAWYVFYEAWNEGGALPRALLVLAILFSVVKTVLSYLLVLVASMGWGITKPFLEQYVVKRILAVGVAYIVFESVRELVMRFRQAHQFSMLFVLMCVIPVSFLNAFLFWWITVSLSELLLALELRKQTAKLALFRRLWWVLVLAVTVAVGALLYQIFVFSMDIAEHWQEQWVRARPTQSVRMTKIIFSGLSN
jgi:hypothetical protein